MLPDNINTTGPSGADDDLGSMVSTDQLLSDLWVGVVLAAMILSCVGCLCTCFLYHIYRQWQLRVLNDHRVENGYGRGYDTASLPSYTVVCGLPTYEEAIEQMKRNGSQDSQVVNKDCNTSDISKLSVKDLMNVYKDIKH